MTRRGRGWFLAAVFLALSGGMIFFCGTAEGETRVLADMTAEMYGEMAGRPANVPEVREELMGRPANAPVSVKNMAPGGNRIMEAAGAEGLSSGAEGLSSDAGDNAASGDGLAEIMGQLDLREIEEYLSGQPAGTSLRFGELVGKLAKGDLSGLAKDVTEAVRSALFSEISSGSRMIGQVLILGILGAMFSSFSSVFQSSQISETGFFVTYLLLFAFLLAAFHTSMEVAAEAVKTILGFMKVLMPAYFLAVAFSGGSVSAAAMYEMTVVGMTAGEWVLHTVMIPLVRVYLVLVMAGNLTKENVFSKLTDMIRQVIGWGLKTLLGLVLGVQLLQTMVLPYVDSLKHGTVQKLVGLIPGVGQGAAAMAQMFLGAGVLIKNSMGIAAVVILAVLIAVPAVKLFVMMILFQCVAAVMEPVCDKRILACVSAASGGHKMLLKIVMTAALLLVITIAVVCLGTNAVYYA